ncbi:MAG: S8 family serine peptidase [Rhizobiaceae bacterium]
MDDVVRRLNLRHESGRTFQLAGATMHLYTIVGGAPVRQVITALQADATVVTAQPNYIYTLAQTTSSTTNDSQYAITRLGITDVHKITRGAGVSVAVIDSGIDFSHPELAANSSVTLDVTSEENPVPHKHGTSIAGIIASAGTLTGVAPEAPVIGIRAFDTSSGEPSSSSWLIATALDMANKNGAGVVNMSFAGPHDPLIERSVAGAAKRGIVTVAAAGNAGPDAAPLYPAAYEEVIAVTAVDSKDGLFAGANTGDYVAISAPGVDILAPAPNGGYDISTGTSMAAAHVSGMIALLLSRKPDLTRANVLQVLGASATDLGAPGVDSQFGLGIPKASSALDALGI